MPTDLDGKSKIAPVSPATGARSAWLRLSIPNRFRGHEAGT